MWPATQGKHKPSKCSKLGSSCRIILCYCSMCEFLQRTAILGRIYNNAKFLFPHVLYAVNGKTRRTAGLDRHFSRMSGNVFASQKLNFSNQTIRTRDNYLFYHHDERKWHKKEITFTDPHSSSNVTRILWTILSCMNAKCPAWSRFMQDKCLHETKRFSMYTDTQTLFWKDHHTEGSL